MKFEQQPMGEVARNEYEISSRPDFKIIKIPRDDVMQEAALLLEEDPKFPDPRGETVNHVRAKMAIREVLKNHGADYFNEELEKQIGRDAYGVLDLFRNR